MHDKFYHVIRELKDYQSHYTFIPRISCGLNILVPKTRSIHKHLFEILVNIRFIVNIYSKCHFYPGNSPGFHKIMEKFDNIHYPITSGHYTLLCDSSRFDLDSECQICLLDKKVKKCDTCVFTMCRNCVIKTCRCPCCRQQFMKIFKPKITWIDRMFDVEETQVT